MYGNRAIVYLFPYSKFLFVCVCVSNIILIPRFCEYLQEFLFIFSSPKLFV